MGWLWSRSRPNYSHNDQCKDYEKMHNRTLPKLFFKNNPNIHRDWSSFLSWKKKKDQDFVNGSSIITQFTLDLLGIKNVCDIDTPLENEYSNIMEILESLEQERYDYNKNPKLIIPIQCYMAWCDSLSWFIEKSSDEDRNEEMISFYLNILFKYTIIQPSKIIKHKNIRNSCYPNCLWNILLYKCITMEYTLDSYIIFIYSYLLLEDMLILSNSNSLDLFSIGLPDKIISLFNILDHQLDQITKFQKSFDSKYQHILLIAFARFVYALGTTFKHHVSLQTKVAKILYTTITISSTMNINDILNVSITAILVRFAWKHLINMINYQTHDIKEDVSDNISLLITATISSLCQVNSCNIIVNFQSWYGYLEIHNFQNSIDTNIPITRWLHDFYFQLVYDIFSHNQYQIMHLFLYTWIHTMENMTSNCPWMLQMLISTSQLSLYIVFIQSSHSNSISELISADQYDELVVRLLKVYDEIKLWDALSKFLLIDEYRIQIFNFFGNSLPELFLRRLVQNDYSSSYNLFTILVENIIPTIIKDDSLLIECMQLCIKPIISFHFIHFDAYKQKCDTIFSPFISWIKNCCPESLSTFIFNDWIVSILDLLDSLDCNILSKQNEWLDYVFESHSINQEHDELDINPIQHFSFALDNSRIKIIKKLSFLSIANTPDTLSTYISKILMYIQQSNGIDTIRWVSLCCKILESCKTELESLHRIQLYMFELGYLNHIISHDHLILSTNKSNELCAITIQFILLICYDNTKCIQHCLNCVPSLVDSIFDEILQEIYDNFNRLLYYDLMFGRLDRYGFIMPLEWILSFYSLTRNDCDHILVKWLNRYYSDSNDLDNLKMIRYILSKNKITMRWMVDISSHGNSTRSLLIDCLSSFVSTEECYYLINHPFLLEYVNSNSNIHHDYFSFDSPSSCIELSDTKGLNIICGWFCITSPCIMFKLYCGIIYLNKDMKIIFKDFNAIEHVISEISEDQTFLSKWHYILLIKTAKTLILYVQGTRHSIPISELAQECITIASKGMKCSYCVCVYGEIVPNDHIIFKSLPNDPQAALSIVQKSIKVDQKILFIHPETFKSVKSVKLILANVYTDMYTLCDRINACGGPCLLLSVCLDSISKNNSDLCHLARLMFDSVCIMISSQDHDISISDDPPYYIIICKLWVTLLCHVLYQFVSSIKTSQDEINLQRMIEILFNTFDVLSMISKKDEHKKDIVSYYTHYTLLNINIWGDSYSAMMTMINFMSMMLSAEMFHGIYASLLKWILSLLLQHRHYDNISTYRRYDETNGMVRLLCSHLGLLLDSNQQTHAQLFIYFLFICPSNDLLKYGLSILLDHLICQDKNNTNHTFFSIPWHPFLLHLCQVASPENDIKLKGMIVQLIEYLMFQVSSSQSQDDLEITFGFMIITFLTSNSYTFEDVFNRIIIRTQDNESQKLVVYCNHLMGQLLECRPMNLLGYDIDNRKSLLQYVSDKCCDSSLNAIFSKYPYWIVTIMKLWYEDKITLAKELLCKTARLNLNGKKHFFIQLFMFSVFELHSSEDSLYYNLPRIILDLIQECILSNNTKIENSAIHFVEFLYYLLFYTRKLATKAIETRISVTKSDSQIPLMMDCHVDPSNYIELIIEACNVILGFHSNDNNDHDHIILILGINFILRLLHTISKHKKATEIQVTRLIDILRLFGLKCSEQSKKSIYSHVSWLVKATQCPIALQLFLNELLSTFGDASFHPSFSDSMEHSVEDKVNHSIIEDRISGSIPPVFISSMSKEYIDKVWIPIGMELFKVQLETRDKMTRISLNIMNIMQSLQEEQELERLRVQQEQSKRLNTSRQRTELAWECFEQSIHQELIGMIAPETSCESAMQFWKISAFGNRSNIPVQFVPLKPGDQLNMKTRFNTISGIQHLSLRDEDDLSLFKSRFFDFLFPEKDASIAVQSIVPYESSANLKKELYDPFIDRLFLNSRSSNNIHIQNKKRSKPLYACNNCAMILYLGEHFGTLMLTRDNQICFTPSMEENFFISSILSSIRESEIISDENSFIHFQSIQSSTFSTYPNDFPIGKALRDRICRYRFDVSKLKSVYERRYLFKRTALEFYFVDGTSLLIRFPGEKHVKAFQEILKKIVPSGVFPMSNIQTTLSLLVEKWTNNKLTNFDYLMELNRLACRSFNDLSQYPVFPWILRDYVSTNIDLDDPSIYRDLGKPIGALNPDRLASFLERYWTYEDIQGRADSKFHYGTHYSSPSGVLYYLLRIEPFTWLHLQLQGGKLDVPDRLFTSIKSTWQNVLSSSSDVKELVPEFFYMPEFLINGNNLNFGTKQDGNPVSECVELPPWANSSPVDFIRLHRAALESDYVSDNLHLWVDLIFGYRQKGTPAIQASNIFYYLTYDDALKELENITDIKEKRILESQIQYFGQTPVQLFSLPHPKKKHRIDNYGLSIPMNFIGKSTNISPNSIIWFGLSNMDIEENISNTNESTSFSNTMNSDDKIAVVSSFDECSFAFMDGSGSLCYASFGSTNNKMIYNIPITIDINCLYSTFIGNSTILFIWLDSLSCSVHSILWKMNQSSHNQLTTLLRINDIGFGTRITALCITNGGKFVAIGLDSGMLALYQYSYNTQGFPYLQRITNTIFYGHNNAVQSLAINYEHRILVSGAANCSLSNNNPVYLFDLFNITLCKPLSFSHSISKVISINISSHHRYINVLYESMPNHSWISLFTICGIEVHQPIFLSKISTMSWCRNGFAYVVRNKESCLYFIDYGSKEPRLVFSDDREITCLSPIAISSTKFQYSEECILIGYEDGSASMIFVHCVY